jgi:hypothetical protein
MPPNADLRPRRSLQESGFFREFQNGFLSSNEDDEVTLQSCYYLAIIDFGQPFNLRKRAEKTAKTLFARSEDISAIEPLPYATRFVCAITALCDPYRNVK